MKRRQDEYLNRQAFAMTAYEQAGWVKIMHLRTERHKAFVPGALIFSEDLPLHRPSRLSISSHFNQLCAKIPGQRRRIKRHMICVCPIYSLVLSVLNGPSCDLAAWRERTKDEEAALKV